ncbi:cytochrome c oxidase assembly protein [Rhizobium brockwellii]|uniref:Cytochrome c oxidase assembly protein n=2 Tax=Rhizobium TaxID=379 RepID=A0ABD7PK30_RHILE|nr:cytochrome c oxidase assembly protein [Rhizobium brockwellii]TAV64658.1 cytochrome c oxidase assembly protein [Rhizobium leguminosarum]MDV4183084.1 cytochrome c oxidase assembly protein [Rhizobium brockwellii]TAV65117.1 cytochrome c oxidase assembly protein [Rhizobium leguminosarum]TAW25106.1 cytochrome c oxidase assembly protein [Rhizobium leguminosarum]TAW38878.1 cytochrome c oxidase assembly protein [Rhizobium leguminosarum]
MSALICTLIFLTIAAPTMAHGDDDHAATLSWTFDPWIVLPIALISLLYVAGRFRLSRRAHRSRPMRWRDPFFCSAMLTLAGALISPLHWLGEHLFTFHMIEHEIVMAVSAPLIVLARPVGLLLWGLPRRARRGLGAGMRSPLIRRSWDWSTGATNATVIHGVAIWGWHLPFLFDVAVTNTAMHRLQHLSFFATAILFWWAVVWKSDHGAAAWHMFLTMLHTSILGALMALAPRVLYIAQTQAASAWGLTPLEDQQLAGMIMWVPAGTIYAAAAMTMLALWIRGSSERGAQNA